MLRGGADLTEMGLGRLTSSVCSRPRLRGRVWGVGDLKCSIIVGAPSLSLQPKSDLSDFGQVNNAAELG